MSCASLSQADPLLAFSVLQPLFNDIRDLTPQPTSTNETIAVAAVSAAMEQDAAALLVLTTRSAPSPTFIPTALTHAHLTCFRPPSGVSAALLAKYRPAVPILTITRNSATARQLSLHRGCYTFWYPEPKISEGSTEWQVDVDNRIRFGLKAALELRMIKPGQTVVAIQVRRLFSMFLSAQSGTRSDRLRIRVSF